MSIKVNGTREPGAKPPAGDTGNPAHANMPAPRGGVFWRFAARSLKLNRTRTIVSIIGIALSCALITAIFTSVASLYNGLLTAEIKNEGTWQVELVNIDARGLERLKSDNRVDKTYLREIYGSALMPKSFEGYWGRYLDVQAWPEKDEVQGLKPLPHIIEGRAPEAPGEIVLTNQLKGATIEDGQFLYDTLTATGKDDDVPRATWTGKVEIGTTIENIALGQRTFVDPKSGAEAPCFYNESLLTDSEGQGDVISEYLADPSPATSYTVVGFYGPTDERPYDVWADNAPGYVGFVSGDTLAPRSVSAYITTHLKNRSDIEQITTDYTDREHALFFGGSNRGSDAAEQPSSAGILHDSLLRYQGMVDDRSIWGTLYTLAAILSCVVIAASVSLIYNSFAIAVSERTRQFGLLSSLGASKRQLRRTVYAEALMLAVIGIPVGLALGIAGTTVVFAISGEGIGMLIDQNAFAGSGVSAVSVEPVILAISALLALTTVLISAAVPAWRASRVSAIDAIRQMRDIKLSRRERREGKCGNAGGKPAAFGHMLDNLRLRLCGVPGLLAHRNLSRASAKGRVAVASLAVSVALIIISGGISHYMSKLTEVSGSGGADIEVTISRSLKEGESTADGVASLEELYGKLGSVKGAASESLVTSSSLYAKFDPGVIDLDGITEMAVSTMSDTELLGKTSDGAAYSPLTLLFADDATWRALLAENGLDTAHFSYAEQPRAVALNNVQYSTMSKYAFSNPFTKTGNVQLFTDIDCEKTDYLNACGVDAEGVPVARYEGFVGAPDSDAPAESDSDQRFGSYERPLSEVLRATYDLEIGAVVDTAPETIRYLASGWPTLVLPLEALPTLARDSEGIVSNGMTGSLAAPFAFHSEDGTYGTSIDALLSYSTSNAREAETAMNNIREAEATGYEWHRSYLVNNAENARAGRLMGETVQLFINCFILITGAIAVANVFNTLTNSIILRRREFAMLKSIGMGDRAFWRMIALECLSYAWRGLVFGLILGAVVVFLIYQSMMMSFQGLGFVVPFGWVLAAVCVVIAVLALSTVYALRKSSAGPIVQTLREDAI